MSKKAVILLSGGLDSTTCVAIARSEGFECYLLSIDYGQRNVVELESARKIADYFNVKDHKIVSLKLNAWGGSALTDHSLPIPDSLSDDIPNTYVPARNTIFLSLALGYAESLQAYDIFIGVNAVDYSNYPDCRPEYIAAFTQMANLATREGVEGRHVTIHTPLIDLTKADIIKKGQSLGVDYAMTHTCYNPHDDGSICGVCDACRLRAKGFADLAQ